MRTALELLVVTMLSGLVVLTAFALALRYAVRRARRALAVRLRSALPQVSPLAAREVAAVRRDLRRDLAGTAHAVRAARSAGRPVEGLGAIVRRLQEQARSLDLDLLVVAAEPDRLTRQALLGAEASRVALLRRACGEVRRGVVLAGTATLAPVLDGLVAELNDEVIALGLRAQAHRELSAG